MGSAKVDPRRRKSTCRSKHNGKPRKTDGGEGKPKTKDGEAKDGKTKGKGGLSLDRCGWCDTEGASRTCSQCRSVVYCSPACQKVSA